MPHFSTSARIKDYSRGVKSIEIIVYTRSLWSSHGPCINNSIQLRCLFQFLEKTGQLNINEVFFSTV